MRGLRPLDRVLFIFLVPLWVVGLTLGLTRGPEKDLAGIVTGSLLLSYPESSEAHPEVLYVGDVAFEPEASRLRAGDRLVAVGEADLRGLGPLEVVVRVHEQAAANPEWTVFEYPVRYLRDGVPAETGLRVVRRSNFHSLLIALILGGVAVLVRLRAPHSPSVRPFFILAILVSVDRTDFAGGSEAQIYAYTAIEVLVAALWAPLLLWWALLTPEEAAPTARWPYALAWLGLLACVFHPTLTFISLAHEVIDARTGLALFFAIYGLFALAGPAVVAWNYRNAGPIGRRQVRWLLLAVSIAGLGFAIGYSVALFDPRLVWVLGFTQWLLLLLPIGLAISILRFNLYDIDRLIGATAAYGLVLGGAVASGLLLVPQVARALSTPLGVEEPSVQIGLALVLAAVVVPVQRSVRPWIDGWFFKERVALDQGFEILLRDLSGCESPRALLEQSGERLHALLRPDLCVIYGLTPHGFAAVFVRGRVVPAAVEAGSALVATLAERAAPLARERWATRQRSPALTPFDRAVLETLGAEVVIPVRRHDRLSGFVCLGTKRSGDVYTSTDLSLLAGVAHKMSSELDRFAEAEVQRHKEAMRQALRRYVPKSVAARVESNQDLRAAAQELSILFTDIREYGRFAEARSSEQVFEALSRYASTVSNVVQKHGGTLVEFEGDGIMAVFGAPDRLPQKERAALDAANEIVAKVRELGFGDDHDAGVGVATGEAFVGNLETADRVIWAAIGRTTNLAARLEALTRDLHAAIVLDRATHSAVGGAARDFEAHPNTRIRGRSGTETVYALPLDAGLV